jgi:hypothetical protein
MERLRGHAVPGAAIDELELGFLLLEPVADEVEVSLSLIIDNI